MSNPSAIASAAFGVAGLAIGVALWCKSEKYRLTDVIRTNLVNAKDDLELNVMKKDVEDMGVTFDPATFPSRKSLLKRYAAAYADAARIGLDLSGFQAPEEIAA